MAIINGKSTFGTTNLSRNRNLGINFTKNLQKKAVKNIGTPKQKEGTSTVRNPEFDKLTEEEKERSRQVGSLQDSRGNFRPGVTAEDKAAFTEFFVNPLMEKTSSINVIDPFFGQKKESGGLGKGTVPRSFSSLFAASEAAKGRTQDLQSREDIARGKFLKETGTQFGGEIKTATTEGDVAFSRFFESRQTSDQKTPIKTQEEFQSDLIQGFGADNRKSVSTASKRSGIVEDSDGQILSSGLNHGFDKERLAANKFALDHNITLKQAREVMSKSKSNFETQQKEVKAARAEFDETEEGKGFTERTRAINERAETQFQEEKAARVATFDVSIGERLLDEFADKKLQTAHDRAMEDERTKINKAKAKEVARANERAKEATTQEAADRFLARERRRINDVYGDGETDGKILKEKRVEFDLKKKRGLEDFELQKEQAGIQDIINVGKQGDTAAKRKATEQLNFVSNFVSKDEGDPATVVGRAMQAYTNAITNDVSPKDEQVYQDIDRLINVEGFDPATILETAADSFDGNISKARKYMETRGHRKSEIEAQTENFQREVLNYTQEEIDQDKDVRITLQEMENVINGTITDPLRVARMLDKEKNGMTDSQKKNFIEAALESDETSDEVREYLQRVKPMIFGTDKAKDPEFSELDASIGDDFFAQFPDLTMQDLSEGFTGENEDKIPTSGKVKQYLYTKVLEKKADALLDGDAAGQFKSGLSDSSKDVPEELKDKWYQKIGEFLDNRVFGGLLPGGPKPGEGSFLGIVNIKGTLPGQENKKPQDQTTETTIIESISKYTEEFGVDRDLVESMIQQESGGQSGLTSSAGAQGEMQLMPATAARFGVTDPFDTDQNIMGGVKYMSWLLNRYDGNEALALAAYNSGEGNVDLAIKKADSTDWDVVRDNLVTSAPNQTQTRNYVKNILAMKSKPKTRTFVKANTAKAEEGDTKAILDEIFE